LCHHFLYWMIKSDAFFKRVFTFEGKYNIFLIIIYIGTLLVCLNVEWERVSGLRVWEGYQG
jgi:hypothetical protein